jgi:late competence protein required for DNA uptake (superfamily II DNA/RNA helicase)
MNDRELIYSRRDQLLKAYFDNKYNHKKKIKPKIQRQTKYKCRHCGETDQSKMYCYDTTKKLYAHNLCKSCYDKKRKKILLTIDYLDDEIINITVGDNI